MVFFRKRDLLAMLAEDFTDIRCVHDQMLLDFQRPARLRGGPLDAWILRLSRLPGAAAVVWALAQLGLTGRVAFRCRRGGA